MFAIDNIRIATRNFKTRKLRSFLTVLGIGIGIATTLFLVSLGYGLQKILLEKIANSDTLLTLDVSVDTSKGEVLSQDKVDQLAKIENVVEISPMKNVASAVNTGSVTSNVSFFAVSPSYFRLGGIELLEGEKFVGDNDAKIILSSGAAKTIGFEDSKTIIGQEVEISLVSPSSGSSGDQDTQIAGGAEGAADKASENGNANKLEGKFTVSGLVDDEANSFGYLPISWANRSGFDNYESVKVKVANKNLLEQVRNAIIGNGFAVQSISDTVDEANKIFTVIQIVLAMFGFVALFVSAIGTFNTMTIALLERTSEIGIMKSIGASNREIMMLFLTESILIGFLGGIGGTAIGLTASTLVNFGFNFLAKNLGGTAISIFYTPLWFILFIIAFSTTVGFMTGVYPAIRASKINPLVALRYK